MEYSKFTENMTFILEKDFPVFFRLSDNNADKRIKLLASVWTNSYDDHLDDSNYTNDNDHPLLMDQNLEPNEFNIEFILDCFRVSRGFENNYRHHVAYSTESTNGEDSIMRRKRNVMLVGYC